VARAVSEAATRDAADDTCTPRHAAAVRDMVIDDYQCVLTASAVGVPGA
jgi:hypothetical protein